EVRPSTTTDPAGAAELTACVAQGLSRQFLGEYTPRLTDVRIHLRFEPSGQRRPRVAPRRPPRPRSVLPGPATPCERPPRSFPRDSLDHDAAVLVISDWDSAEHEREANARLHRERAAWRRGGKQGAEPQRQPEVIPASEFVRVRPREEDLLAAVVSNLGAYQACYAAAVRRAPDRPPSGAT